jgi:ubiquinone/menaquinone biosynthesis C-methylase UbiE
VEDPTAGQAIYTASFLRTYDALVHGFNGPVLWRCRKGDLVNHYSRHASARHLDIGVGTGCLLDECRFRSPDPEITLMDLNPNSLDRAAIRLRRFSPRVQRANVLDDWGFPPESFQSVGMNYLLHCLPGAMPEKAVGFEHARVVLAPGGVLFGSTVLAAGVSHTRRSRLAMRFLNHRGVFSNEEDYLEDLEAGLARTFDSHEIRVQGAVALFSARA